MSARSPFIIGAFAFLLAFIGFTHMFRVGAYQYRQGFDIPSNAVAGWDFMLARESAINLAAGAPPRIMYPPFAVATFLPFITMESPISYRVLCIFLILALYLLVFLTLRESQLLDPPFDFLAAAALTAVLYHAYWFQFELERGNSNVIVAAFCAGGLLALSRGRPMLAAVLLVVATQLRIFPAILIAPLFLRGGWRPALLFVALNVAALFCAGWATFQDFYAVCKSASHVVMGGRYSHSLATLAAQKGFAPQLATAKTAIIAVFALLCALQWFAMRKAQYVGDGVRFKLSEVGLIGVAFQVMALLPNISFDYKLSIHAVPFLLLITRPSLEDDFSIWIWAPLICAAGALFGYMSSPGLVSKGPAIAWNAALYLVVALLGVYRSFVSARRSPVRAPAGANVGI